MQFPDYLSASLMVLPLFGDAIASLSLHGVRHSEEACIERFTQGKRSKVAENKYLVVNKFRRLTPFPVYPDNLFSGGSSRKILHVGSVSIPFRACSFKSSLLVHYLVEMASHYTIPSFSTWISTFLAK